MKQIEQDLYRVIGTKSKKRMLRALKYDFGFRFMFFWRFAKKTNGLSSKICKKILWNIEKTTGIEIPITVQIGEGCRLLHPHNITINENAVIGRNAVLLKGATIGQIKRGKKSGVPKIGDDFYLGLNATVVGGITIGNDVLIAANTFVDFDVPSHSVVIGNPGVIHYKEGATKDYITNRI